MFGFVFWWVVIWLMMYGACSKTWLSLVGVYGYSTSYILMISLSAVYCFWTCWLADERIKNKAPCRQTKFASIIIFFGLTYICAPFWVIGGGIMHQYGDLTDFLYTGVFLFSFILIGILCIVYVVVKNIYNWLRGK